MPEAFIFDAVRTPRGKGRPGGALHEVTPLALLSGLMRDLQQRNRLDTSRLDDVLIGCVQTVGPQYGVIARMAALRAGWHWQVPGAQINRYCGSGLDAAIVAAEKIRAGWNDLIVAGGVECMSRIPFAAHAFARDLDPAAAFALKAIPQGLSADLLATLDGRTRAQLDEVACSSQQRATRARAEQRFSRSLIPVCDANGLTLLDHDELVREDTTLERLAQLKPSFADIGAMGMDDLARSRYPQVECIDHQHTPGNASGIVDGASLLLIGSEAIGRELGLTPRARIVSAAALGDESTLMLSAPGPVSHKALVKAGLLARDIDLFEVNEAFASVVLRFVDDLKIPMDQVNVNGGAIAMGHPLGATGGMLLGTLLDELERTGARRGLVSLCAADGMGLATIIERL